MKYEQLEAISRMHLFRDGNHVGVIIAHCAGYTFFDWY